MSSMIPQLPRTCGVYRITCIPTGKIYIGSSVNLRRRWHDHQSRLNAKNARNLHFQRAWDKYGADAFCFDILEYCNIEEVLIREQYYLNALRPFDRGVGFNIALDAKAPTLGRKNHKPRRKVVAPPKEKRAKIITAETRKKMSESAKRRAPPVAATMKAAKINKGRKKSEETRRKMSHAGLNRQPDHNRKIGVAQKGRVFSEETRRKMSESARIRCR